MVDEMYFTLYFGLLIILFTMLILGSLFLRNGKKRRETPSKKKFKEKDDVKHRLLYDKEKPDEGFVINAKLKLEKKRKQANGEFRKEFMGQRIGKSLKNETNNQEKNKENVAGEIKTEVNHEVAEERNIIYVDSKGNHIKNGFKKTKNSNITAQISFDAKKGETKISYSKNKPSEVEISVNEKEEKHLEKLPGPLKLSTNKDIKDEKSVENVTVEKEVVTEKYADGTVIKTTLYKELITPERHIDDAIQIDLTTQYEDKKLEKPIKNIALTETSNSISISEISSLHNSKADCNRKTSAKDNNVQTNCLFTENIDQNDESSKRSLLELNLYVDNILSQTFIDFYNDIKVHLTKGTKFNKKYTNRLTKEFDTEVSNINNEKNCSVHYVEKNKSVQKIVKKKYDRHYNDLIYDFANTVVNNVLNNVSTDLYSNTEKKLDSENFNGHSDLLENTLSNDAAMSFKAFRKYSLTGKLKKKNERKKSDSKNQKSNENEVSIVKNNNTGLKNTEVEVIVTSQKPNIVIELESTTDSNDLSNDTVRIDINNGNVSKPQTILNQTNFENESDTTSEIQIDKVNANDSSKVTENLTETDGTASTLVNKNKSALRRNGTLSLKNRPISDRPLSGFAEKLAELLADEDDEEIEFIDSDENFNESLSKIKDNFARKPSISHEIENLQRRFSVDEINNFSSKKFKSKVDGQKSTRKKNRRTRGERPKSLYAQDLMNDLLNVPDTFEDEEGAESEGDVLEDKIQPVKATVDLLEHVVPIHVNGLQKDSLSGYEEAFDDILRSPRFESMISSRPGEKPYLRRAAVIDAGCGVLKAGFCGEITPKCYCPSVIGTPRRFSQDVSKMKRGYYVGDEAWSYAGMLQIDHPIRQNITNWSDVTSIIEYLLETELEINDSEHPVLLTEMALTSMKHREKLTEIMFEKFGVPAFYLANQGALALYSMGLTSGLCLNSGFSTTQAISVYEGHVIPHATSQLDIGGDHVSSYLGRMLMGNSGFTFNSSSEKLVLNSMKQSVCYVALDAKEEEDKYKTTASLLENFTLPDGQIIEIGADRCIAPEILFDPQMLGLHQPNTAELVTESISMLDNDIKELLYSNLLVSGGNTKLQGYSERLEKELTYLCRDLNYNIKPKYADDRILSTWIGGSVLSSISGFRDQWITIDQYAELGSKTVHMLCF